MKSSYVNQCSCCDKRFMRIELEQRIPEYLERDFVELLGNDVDYIFLSKQFYFTLEGGYIVSFYYEFQNVEEELSAKDLVCSVKTICNYLYKSYVDDKRKMTGQKFAQ